MYGIFDIDIGLGDSTQKTKAFNHLTRAGLQHVLKGKPERTQTVITPNANNKIFTNVLNYMFIVLGNKDEPSPIKNEDIYALTFDNLPANIKWVQRGSEEATANYALGEMETIYIKGIGIGHKDIGGDPANNFIFSYANMEVIISNVNAYDGTSKKAPYWRFAADYNFYEKSVSLPALKFNIGGTNYKFVESKEYETITGFMSSFTNALGFSNWTGPNITSMTSGKPAFYWCVCGKAGAQAESFDEQIVEDPITRELTRVFKVVYNNTRPFDIDITGFFYIWGTQYFNYRSEIDNYIRVPAGKKLELTFALDIAGGATPTVDNKYITYNTPPTFSGYSANSLKTHTNFAKIHYVQYEGTSKEKKNSYTDMYASASNWFNDELTKVYLEYTDGTFSAPGYILGTKVPPSYVFAAPSVATSDGWVLQNNKLMFALTAPTGVTKVQFGSKNNQWVTFDVTGGTINYFDLPLRCLYEGEMFIRWSNGTTTGLITYYNTRTTNTTEMVCFEPVTITGQNAGYHIVGLPSRQVVPYPWQTTTDANLNTWYDNTKQVNTNELYAPITLGNFSSAIGARLPSERKWFNPVTKTLDAVPNFVMVRASVPAGSYNGYPDSGKRNPTQTTTIVPVTFNGTPRVSELTRVKNPTVAAPNKIKLTTLTGTRKVEIYNTDDNSVIKTLDVNPGSDYVIEITEPLYNHIFYGVRYRDSNNINQSLGLEYLFKGVQLAKPDDVAVINYDISAKTLTFNTPARAKRATITRWGFELYSFETTPNGETVLATSEAFDTTGNYILTLFNDEGVPGNPYYIFGQQPDDQPVKPGTTGPYHFNDWSYSSNDYSSNGFNLPFMKIELFEADAYKIKLDGKLARVVKKVYNPSNLLMEVLFEAEGVMARWRTGYIETNTQPGVGSSTSDINIIMGGNGYSIIEVWNEWDLYSKLGIDTYGIYGYGKFTPKYGKNTSWYQFSEIQTGYVRNSLKLLLRRNSAGRLPFEFDTTLTAKTPYAQVYLHTNEILGSPNFVSNVNSQYYKHTSYTAYINGVEATWEPTYAENGTTITKLKAVTPECTMVYDTSNKSIGWTIEGLDKSHIGEEGWADKSYTFELYNGNKSTWSYFLSISPDSNYINADVTSAVRYAGTYYNEQIYTKFYPYMNLLSFEEATGIQIEKAPYDYYGDHSGNANARWAEAYFETDISKMMDNTSVVINGKLATIATKEVTLPFKPSPQGIISTTQYEKPSRPGFNDVRIASQEQFTFTAYVFTIDNIVISNEKHPNVLSIISDTRTNTTDLINFVFVRNKILQPVFPIGWYSNTANVRPNNAINQYGNYYYNYTTAALYPDYPKIMKDMSSNGNWDLDVNFVLKPELSSLYMIRQAIQKGVPQGLVDIPENNTYSSVFKINGESFNLVIDEAWKTYLQEETPAAPYAGNIFKLVNLDNDKEISFDANTVVTYVGFTSGQELNINIARFDLDARQDLVETILAYYEDMRGSPVSIATETNASGMIFGYNKSTFWNYLAHTLPTGLQGLKLSITTKIPTETVRDENFVVPDRRETLISRFNTSFKAEYNISLGNSYFTPLFNPEAPNFNIISEHVKVSCNDVLFDTFEVDAENNFIFKFTDLNVAVKFTVENKLVLWDTLTNAPLARDELLIFSFRTTGLSMLNNSSPLVLNTGDPNEVDAPLYNAYWSTLSFYNDINGTERIQTMYLLIGNKPREEVPIDPRIGKSPFPEFSETSYTYCELKQMEMPS